jgi:hypothetical protein
MKKVYIGFQQELLIDQKKIKEEHMNDYPMNDYPLFLKINYNSNVQKEFEALVGSDYDYMIIAASAASATSNNNFCDLYRDVVPREGEWETIEEAIEWCFEKDIINSVYVYDLYAPFETSLIEKLIKKSE